MTRTTSVVNLFSHSAALTKKLNLDISSAVAKKILY